MSFIAQQLENILNIKILGTRSVSGGDINQALLLECDDNKRYFLKYNSHAGKDMFEKETLGLKLLDQDNIDIRIPEVIHTGYIDSINTGYLVLEYIQTGREDRHFFSRFGQQLAEMHHITNDHFGLDHDNYIGRLPQSNHWHEKWLDFFIEERINPQLKKAIDSRRLSNSLASQFEVLYSTLPDLFPNEPASLLHGDLWSGNFMCSDQQDIVLIDPAVYFGNREIELAFTKLFGGFDHKFYEAYEASNPLQPGFDERKDIYNLYPLLVHTNLFGGSYANSVINIVSQYT